MVKAKNSAAESPQDIGAAGLTADQNVDKIRDILFGGQMRDYDERFARLEKSLAEQADRLAADMDLRMSKLEEFVRGEFKDVGERLVRERNERARERGELTENLQHLRRDSEAWVADLSEVSANETRAIRASLHDQAGELMDLVRQTREQADAALNEEARRLGDAKVSREDLAALLSEVALRLNREFDLPAGD